MEAEEQFSLEDFAVGSLQSLFYLPDFISESEDAQLLSRIYEAPLAKWKSLKNRRLQNWGGVVHEKGLLPQELPPWLSKITQRICKQTGFFPSAINHVLINEYLPDQGIMPHQDGPAYFPVVAILSLGSPVVMDFTPHPRLKDCMSKDEKIDEVSTADRNAAVMSDDMSNDLFCRQTEDHQPFSLLLMPRSLLIFKDEAYSDYLHGIEDSNRHSLHKVVNIREGLKHQEQNSSLSSEETLDGKDADQPSGIHRTATRVSLTCRLVLKVHRNLFKF